MPYFEVWVDLTRKEEIFRKLRDIFPEVYEAFYDYHFIVNADSAEEVSRVDGVKYVKSHYNC
ncbi:hypothetical protein [Geoglobus acetivorans]|uniref:Uncharacterized protein n=1 Tax=Geoglobus acetivorans TaxID=565033 RepID=A0ABZ3H3R2_GEOAI|nr:hypothetical protein [Geoglobus acetivorans]